MSYRGQDRSRGAPTSYRELDDDRRPYDARRRDDHYSGGGGGGRGGYRDRDWGRSGRGGGGGGSGRDWERERDRSRSPVRRRDDREEPRSRDYRRSPSPIRTGTRSPPPAAYRRGEREPDRGAKLDDRHRDHDRRPRREDEHSPRDVSAKGGWDRDERHVPAPRQERERSDSGPVSMAEDDEGAQDPDAAAMAALMGFAGFDTTKAKHVQEDLSAVSIKQERKHRQYMNRKGGFNRPLDKIR